jgi:hypothetical protein
LKLINELQILLGGDNNGSINIYTWPLKGFINMDTFNEMDYDSDISKSKLNCDINLNDSLIHTINLDEGCVSKLISFKNYS